MEIVLVTSETGNCHLAKQGLLVQSGELIIDYSKNATSHTTPTGFELVRYRVADRLFDHKVASLRNIRALRWLRSSDAKTSVEKGRFLLHLEDSDARDCRCLLILLGSFDKSTCRSLAREEQSHHLDILFALLARNSLDVLQRSSDSHFHPSARVVKDLINSDIAHSWTIKELASEVKTEERYLIRIFRSMWGLAPIQYLNRLRLETSARHLAHTDSLVSEIGSKVGWDDANYFARRFRMHFGVSPLSYRKLRLLESPASSPTAICASIVPSVPHNT